MKQILTIVLLGLMLHAVHHTGQAIPITGELNMGGVATLDNSHLDLATGVTSFIGVKANAASDGVFAAAGLARAPIAMSPFNWNPSSAPVTPLWNFTHDGISFAFNLDSLTVVEHNANFLNLTGTGTLTSSHYESVAGAWTFTISDSDGIGGGAGQFKFGFQSSSTAALAVPDGGFTAALLGVTFLGFAACRRSKE